MSAAFSRRRLLGGLAAGGGGVLLAGCDKVVRAPFTNELLGLGARATYAAQRLVADRRALAPEFGLGDLSPVFRVNGTGDPGTPAYAAMVADGFAQWRLAVDGLVARPLALSLAQLMAAPRRTQVTRHDCVEGWSAIGQWTGTPLGLLLHRAGLRSDARYIVFHCADSLGGTPYYESIDLVDAFHPQTILAWGMNGARLGVGHGAPVRLRVERQLGYKQAKYVMAVEAVASLAGIGRGQGGYWEDAGRYQWYAGI